MSEEHAAPPTELETRVKALESLLVETGRTSTDAIEAIVQTYEREIGPHLGARVVARAWVDPEFRQRLLDDGTSAIAELGLGGAQTEVLVVKENTRAVHNVVVCTLCSCYPWAVLGLPPTWYKSPAYRSRVVREPREVLREFGVELDGDIEIRVWDSTSEVRYLVLPQRPSGTQGWSPQRLAELVTRDAMIGVGTVSVA